VRGTENWKDCTPDNSLYLPFMRNVAGPMSFCPGAMLTVQPEQYSRLGPNLVLTGTRAHHIAYYILFESGLQMISDSPRQFDQNPDCRDFIFSTPVTWDETHALAAEAGQYAVVARRHGDKWWDWWWCGVPGEQTKGGASRLPLFNNSTVTKNLKNPTIPRANGMLFLFLPSDCDFPSWAAVEGDDVYAGAGEAAGR
jgi:hypothetical protein